MTRCFSILALLGAMAWVPAPKVQATHPVAQIRYRFLPSYSVLTESYLQEDVEVDYTVYGPFDFFVDHDDIDYTSMAARFTNVEAWAAHPFLDFILPLDQVFNLSALRGKLLPTLGPFDVYQFEGLNEIGAKVDLLATVIGRWFYLRGGTTPPEGKPGLSSFSINAWARSLPFADFDNSGVIDELDLSRWKQYYGLQVPFGEDITTLGDADGNSAVGGRDFLIWQRQHGELHPPASSIANLRAIPEPSTITLLLITAVCYPRTSLRYLGTTRVASR